MENENNVPVQTDWNCPKCEALNMGNENFCKSCGFNRSQESNIGSDNIQGSNKGLTKILIAVILTLFILGGGVGGYYVYYQNKLKKDAKKYLVGESKAFANYTRLVNDLATEKIDNIIDVESDDGTELTLKKAESEKVKSEKVLAELKITREKNANIKANKLVLGISDLLGKHYEDATVQIGKYDESLGFIIASNKEGKRIEDEMERIDKIFSDAKSIEDVSRALRESLKVLDTSLENYKKIQAPDEYKDIQEKEMKLMEGMIGVFRNFANAVETENEQKVSQSMKEFVDFFDDEKKFNEIRDLTRFYLGQMHDRFIGLRRGAEDIKMEFVKSGSVMGAEVEKIDIEAW